MNIERAYSFALLMILAWGVAHGAPKDPVEDAAPIFYPPAPNFPRLQYLQTFATAYDVSAQKGGFRDFVFGGEQQEEQAIQKPYGVAIRDGAILAVDTRGPGYVIFDFANRNWRMVRGQGNGAMNKPINITIDDDGTRYVTDTQRKVILVYNSNDKFVRALGSPGQFRPVDVAIAGNRLYVSDMDHHQIHVLDKTSGEALFTFGGPGPGEGQFAHPANIAIAPDGTVYVTDTNNFRVQQFTPEGEFLRQIGSAGTGFGQFARPKGIAISKDGVIYVVDAAFQNVQMFDDEGRILMFFGGAGSDHGDMNLPSAVVIDYDNVDHFRQYADPDFEIEYLVLVTNQFGPNKVTVYGFGSLKD